MSTRPSATSSISLNTSGNGDSATSLGSPLQCLITLSGEKFLLMSNLNIPWRALRLRPPVLSLVPWEKRPTPTWLQPPPRRLQRARDSPAAGSPIQPIIKDVGEVYSRLLDHRPVIQGEIRYFVKEFEEKRGLRELRVLENLKKTIFETNERVLPKCEQAMQDNLSETFKRLQAANAMIHRLQEREYEVRKLQADKVMAREEKCIAHWEEFMKEQQNKRAEVDEEHRKAMERLREQYSEMEKELAKYVSF
ncbi:biogenesis of lysosome-related organelles complex 1 subunit 5 [Cyanistes caeruleus]|uniref:biogenesis of lysosome-related organelles complex 1 subunit 5 n=1 Tax=Cyanistes caeruleus TaxID=156563 RepID=UPI000CDB9108|nr:biogenesis of lysosome-related organelles complex 1 subunit 5 [Cyanistes caeruleus]